MSTLRVDYGGRTFSFEEPRVVSLGRDPSCDIVLTGPSASRRHAELRSNGTGWTLVDTGSSGGTWLNGTRVAEVRLNGPTVVRLGGLDGDQVDLTVAGLEAARPAFPAGAPAPAGPPPGLDMTVVPGRGPVVPGGFPGAPGGPPGVLVRIGSTSKRFTPGTIVRIGRDPANEIVIDDPAVSRLHATVEMRSDGWWYLDRSTAGTFDEEDRVTNKRLDEPITLMLGHPTAGAEVELVPIVDAQKAQQAIAGRKRKRAALVVGGIVAALVLVGGGIAAVALTGDDDDPTSGGSGDGGSDLSAAELDRAKAASTWIIAVDENGDSLYTGSGAIISEDGLVLTNAHVGKPSSPGQYPPADDPAGLLIALPPEDNVDAAVEIQYTAEPVVSDGVLDLAVLQITGDAEGNAIAPEDLELPEPIPLGDSDDVQTGDDLTALGFPGIAAITLGDKTHRGLTVTRGVASTFNAEDPIGDRAWIDSDLRLGSGNSGGPSIDNDGRLVGINSAVVTAGTAQGQAGEFTGGSALIRPVNLATEIIGIAEEGGDPAYVSPYLDQMDTPPPPDEMGGDASVESGGWSTDGQGGCATPSTIDNPQVLPGVRLPATLFAEYVVSGVPSGTPLEVQFWSLDGSEQLGSITDAWGEDESELCITITVDVPEGLDGLNAVLILGDLEAENPVILQ